VTDKIRAVDLFCGAGGLSWGLVQALEEVAVEAADPTAEVLAELIDLVGVNHWERAIQTHQANHPWARHFHDDVQNVNPREVFDEEDPDVKILSGGIECTHWSTARGGKPVDEQKRMPAWDFLTWVQKLRPEAVLVENVKEFAKWGPIEDDGTPTRNGETFEQWVDSLHALGYSVDWQVLNAADYGDATSRERLFIMATREGCPTFPEPTHGDADDELPDRRTAADIIDWSDAGESIWTRSRPLVQNTMQRIAEGIRRHGDDRLEPFADAVAQLGKEDVAAMQDRVVPAEYAPLVAEFLDEPFLVAPGDDATPALADPHLVKYYGTATAKPVGEPVDTITAGGQKYGLCTPYLLGQQSQATARAVDDRPVPTIATDGYVRLFDATAMVLPRNGYHRGLHSNPAYRPDDRPLHTVTARNHDGHLVTPSLMQFSHGGKLLDADAPLPTITTAKGGVFAFASPRPYIVPYYSERSGQRPRVHSIDEPYPTVTATGSDPYLAAPYLIQYHGQSGAHSVAEPTPTLTARDSLALCVPDLYPWGLDIRFRMLQPRELAAAQGFPEDYEFAGTKTETVEQIGNAVPVNLAQNLVESLLADTTPALTDYLDRGPAVPALETEVAADGGEP
jgi:DNA (cytosine-5)-methyltransferase 1